jgi:hypothetical protein
MRFLFYKETKALKKLNTCPHVIGLKLCLNILTTFTVLHHTPVSPNLPFWPLWAPQPMLSDGVWAFRGCSQELAALVRLLKHHSLISFLFLSFSIFSVLGFEFRASHL